MNCNYRQKVTKCRAFFVAKVVKTFPYIVVSPMTSTSGDCRATNMAMASSEDASIERKANEWIWADYCRGEPDLMEFKTLMIIFGLAIEENIPIPGSVSMMIFLGSAMEMEMEISERSPARIRLPFHRCT